MPVDCVSLSFHNWWRLAEITKEFLLSIVIAYEFKCHVYHKNFATA